MSPNILIRACDKLNFVVSTPDDQRKSGEFVSESDFISTERTAYRVSPLTERPNCKGRNYSMKQCSVKLERVFRRREAETKMNVGTLQDVTMSEIKWIPSSVSVALQVGVYIMI